jgi:hypothetical protein
MSTSRAAGQRPTGQLKTRVHRHAAVDISTRFARAGEVLIRRGAVKLKHKARGPERVLNLSLTTHNVSIEAKASSPAAGWISIRPLPHNSARAPPRRSCTAAMYSNAGNPKDCLAPLNAVRTGQTSLETVTAQSSGRRGRGFKSRHPDHAGQQIRGLQRLQVGISICALGKSTAVGRLNTCASSAHP